MKGTMDEESKCKRIRGFEVCQKDGATKDKQRYEIKADDGSRRKECKTPFFKVKVKPTKYPYDYDKRKKHKYSQVTNKDVVDATLLYAEWLENERIKAIISLVVAVTCGENAPLDNVDIVLYGDDSVIFKIYYVKNNCL